MNGHSSDSPTYVILIVSECQKFFYTVQCTAIYSWSTSSYKRYLLPMSYSTGWWAGGAGGMVVLVGWWAGSGAGVQEAKLVKAE